MILEELVKQKLLTPPEWLVPNLSYLTVFGSRAYQTDGPDSDVDLYGVVVPPRRYLEPSVGQYIPEFDQFERFEQYSQGCFVEGVKHEVTVYNIAKFFRLALDNNPNVLSCLWTPDDCLVQSDEIGKRIRENRHLFLHQGCIKKFLGFVTGCIKKLGGRKRVGSRKELVEQYGYDVKDASHLFRILFEFEQLWTTGDMDLRLHKDFVRAIKFNQSGLSLDQLLDLAEAKENEIKSTPSVLPLEPRTAEVRALLVSCLGL